MHNLFSHLHELNGFYPAFTRQNMCRLMQLLSNIERRCIFSRAEPKAASEMCCHELSKTNVCRNGYDKLRNSFTDRNQRLRSLYASKKPKMWTLHAHGSRCPESLQIRHGHREWINGSLRISTMALLFNQ